jgi:hypothetical protein
MIICFQVDEMLDRESQVKLKRVTFSVFFTWRKSCTERPQVVDQLLITWWMQSWEGRTLVKRSGKDKGTEKYAVAIYKKGK